VLVPDDGKERVESMELFSWSLRSSCDGRIGRLLAVFASAVVRDSIVEISLAAAAISGLWGLGVEKELAICKSDRELRAELDLPALAISCDLRFSRFGGARVLSTPAPFAPAAASS
jgi:hypothetical protein